MRPADLRPRRRDVLALGAGIFVVAAIPLGALRRRELVRRSLPVMGTLADLSAVHRDPRHAGRALEAALGELARVDRAMSRFRADSDVGRVNAAAPGEAVPVADETARVVAEALACAERTGGVFDPCLGRVSQVWDVSRRREPPSEDAYRRFAGRRLHRTVEVGRHRGGPVVVRHDADAALDLGGIAKGHGVDRAVRVLREWGLDDACVNVGGDLYVLGRNAEGEPWRVGVRDPEHPERIAATLRLSDEAVATSGDYEQLFTWRGRRYHHLLDPFTAEPRRTSRRSATVRAGTCLAADAAATAAFAEG